MERNIKLMVAYDGTAYHGFQRQANGITIQEILEDRLAVIFGHPVKVNGSGRTDSGVHAYGQVINFLTTGKIPLTKIPQAVNGILPPDIVIVSAEEAAPDFHARRSAKSKTYIYRIYNAQLRNPFERNHSWHVRGDLNVPLMDKIVQQVVGTHDFSAFRAAGGAPVSPAKTIYQAYCRREDTIVIFSFHGSGFLYHMVRNLVGTIVEIGLGRRQPEEFSVILDSLDRKKAGITAPPEGLYLMSVQYEKPDIPLGAEL